MLSWCYRRYEVFLIIVTKAKNKIESCSVWIMYIKFAFAYIKKESSFLIHHGGYHEFMSYLFVHDNSFTT